MATPPPSSDPGPDPGLPPAQRPRPGDSLAGGSMVGGSMASGSLAGSPTVEGRQTFSPEELAVVLSRYDLGWLDAAQAYPHGSRKAPKLLLRRHINAKREAEDDLDDALELEATGPDTALNAPPDPSITPVAPTAREQIWLLKRRARGRGGDSRIDFCHAVQRHLAAHRFPVAPLVPNCEDQTATAVGQHRYELFEFINGKTYDQSLEATGQAGRILAVFHQLMRHYDYAAASFDPPTNGYHRANAVGRAFNALPTTVLHTDPNVDRIALGTRSQFLYEAINRAADAADAVGLPAWPTQVVHADWHPGNLIFVGQQVAAVIDFDAARVQPRIMDVANGALQFSISGGGEDLSAWPANPDEGRFKRFLRGYDTVPGAVLSRAELRILPQLMIEALISECVIPIAATGRFARTPGAVFLEMIERKVRWLEDHADALFRAVDA